MAAVILYVEAMQIGLEKTRNQVEIYNIGLEDQTNVKNIAETVTENNATQKRQTQTNQRRRHSERLETRRQNMLPDVSKIKTPGWKPKHNIEPEIVKIVKELMPFTCTF
jgi:nucleoside-diphosphate-sugar epimerase